MRYSRRRRGYRVRVARPRGRVRARRLRIGYRF